MFSEKKTQKTVHGVKEVSVKMNDLMDFLIIFQRWSALLLNCIYAKSFGIMVFAFSAWGNKCIAEYLQKNKWLKLPRRIVEE